MSSLSDLLGAASSAISAPGDYLRGSISGQVGQRVGGRGMLENWGLLGQNKPGLDLGDVAGFAADVAVDPLNLIGGASIGLLAKLLRGARGAAKVAKAAQVAKASPAASTLSKTMLDPSLAIAANSGISAATGGMDEAADEILKRILSGSPEEVLGRIRNDRIENIYQGGDWLAQHYLKKLADSGGKNVINPRSGLKMWAEPRRGKKNLHALKRRDIRVTDDTARILEADRLSGNPRMQKFRAWFDSNGYAESPNKLGVRMPMRGLDRKIMRTGEPYVGLPPTNIYSEVGPNVVSDGVHEMRHFLGEIGNIHPDTVKHVQRVNEAAKRAVEKGRIGTPPKDVGYLMEPTEVESRIAEIRRGMEMAELDAIPTNYGKTVHVNQEGWEVPKTLIKDDPNSIRTRYYQDDIAGSPLLGTGANDSLRRMNDVYGPRLLNHLLRVLPVTALAASPLAAARFGSPNGSSLGG